MAATLDDILGDSTAAPATPDTTQSPLDAILAKGDSAQESSPLDDILEGKPKPPPAPGLIDQVVGGAKKLYRGYMDYAKDEAGTPPAPNEAIFDQHPGTRNERFAAALSKPVAADVSAVSPGPNASSMPEEPPLRTDLRTRALVMGKLDRIVADPRTPPEMRHYATALKINQKAAEYHEDLYGGGGAWGAATLANPGNNFETFGKGVASGLDPIGRPLYNPSSEFAITGMKVGGDYPDAAKWKVIQDYRPPGSTGPAPDNAFRYAPEEHSALAEEAGTMLGALPGYMGGAELPGLARLGKAAEFSGDLSANAIVGRTAATASQYGLAGLPVGVASSASQAYERNEPVLSEATQGAIAQMLAGVGIGAAVGIIGEVGNIGQRIGFRAVQRLAMASRGSNDRFYANLKQLGNYLDNTPQPNIDAYIAQLEAGAAEGGKPYQRGGFDPARVLDQANVAISQHQALSAKLADQLDQFFGKKLTAETNARLDAQPRLLPPGQYEIPGPFNPDVPPDRATLAADAGPPRISLRTGRPVPRGEAQTLPREGPAFGTAPQEPTIEQVRRAGPTGGTVTPPPSQGAWEDVHQAILRDVDKTRQMMPAESPPIPEEGPRVNLTEAVHAARADVVRANEQALRAVTPEEKQAATYAIQEAKANLDRAMTLPENVATAPPEGPRPPIPEPPPKLEPHDETTMQGLKRRWADFEERLQATITPDNLEGDPKAQRLERASFNVMYDFFKSKTGMSDGDFLRWFKGSARAGALMAGARMLGTTDEEKNRNMLAAGLAILPGGEGEHEGLPAEHRAALDELTAAMHESHAATTPEASVNAESRVAQAKYALDQLTKPKATPAEPTPGATAAELKSALPPRPEGERPFGGPERRLEPEQLRAQDERRARLQQSNVQPGRVEGAGPIEKTLPPERDAMKDFANPKLEDQDLHDIGRDPGEGQAGPGFRDFHANPVIPLLVQVGKRGWNAGALLALGAYLDKTAAQGSPLQKTGAPIMALAVLHAMSWELMSKPGVAGGKALVAELSKFKVGRRAVEWTNPDAMLTPEASKALDDYYLAKSKGRAMKGEYEHTAAGLGPVGDRKVSDLMEQENLEPGLPDKETLKRVIAFAGEARNVVDRLEKEAHTRGIISDEALLRHHGTYLHRFYADAEAERAVGEQRGGGGGGRPVIRPGYERTLDKPLRDAEDAYNKDPSQENLLAYDKAEQDWYAARAKKGEIRESSFRLGRTIEEKSGDIAAHALFTSLRGLGDGTIHPDWAQARESLDAAMQMAKSAKKGPDLDAAMDLVRQAREELNGITRRYTDVSPGRDYVALPEARALGKLSGAVVTRPVYYHLRNYAKVDPSFLMSWWRSVHTIWNPPTHVGNTSTNIMNLHTAGMPIWEQALSYRMAAKDLASYGPLTKDLTEAGITDQATSAVLGRGASPYSGGGSKAVLQRLAATSRPETQAVLKDYGIEPPSAITEGWRAVSNRVRKAYNNEDNIFRVMYYKKLLADGVPKAEALEKTRTDLIDFRSRSPAVRMIRGSVSPFILWPIKAVPQAAKLIVEHPWAWLSLMSTMGAMDMYSRKKVGPIQETDLRPQDRRNLGYFLPGTMQLPQTDERGGRAVYNMDRLGVFSGITTAAPPGAITSKLYEDYPALLQPNGPIWQIATAFANKQLNADKDLVGANIVRPKDVAGKIADVAEDLALPPTAAFLRRRVMEDIANRDFGKAGTDAGAVLAARPNYIHHGEYAIHAMRQAKDGMTAARSDLLRGAQDAKRNPARQKELVATYRDQIIAINKRFLEHIGRKPTPEETQELVQHITSDEPTPAPTTP